MGAPYRLYVDEGENPVALYVTGADRHEVPNALKEVEEFVDMAARPGTTAHAVEVWTEVEDVGFFNDPEVDYAEDEAEREDEAHAHLLGPVGPAMATALATTIGYRHSAPFTARAILDTGCSGTTMSRATLKKYAEMLDARGDQRRVKEKAVKKLTPKRTPVQK